MDAYEILTFLHIAAVVVGLGATFAIPFLQAAAERKGVAATRFVHEFVQRLEKLVIIPGAVLVFVFGLGLFFDDTNSYSDSNPAWLSVSMAWFIVAFAVALFLQRRNVAKALDALRGVPDSAPLPEAYLKIAKMEQIVGGLLGLSVIGIALLMVWKPGN